MAVKPIPEGYHTITPYLVVRGAQKTIDFAKNAFGAEVVFEPMKRPDGTILHGEFKVGDSRIMISDATEEHPAKQTMLYVYVPDVDAVFQKAIKAGGKSLHEPMDQFYGDRSGSVQDAAGNHWEIGTHKEDVAPDEIRKRAKKMFEQGSKAA